MPRKKLTARIETPDGFLEMPVDHSWELINTSWTKADGTPHFQYGWVIRYQGIWLCNSLAGKQSEVRKSLIRELGRNLSNYLEMKGMLMDLRDHLTSDHPAVRDRDEIAFAALTKMYKGVRRRDDGEVVIDREKAWRVIWMRDPIAEGDPLRFVKTFQGNAVECYVALGKFLKTPEAQKRMKNQKAANRIGI